MTNYGIMPNSSSSIKAMGNLASKFPPVKIKSQTRKKFLKKPQKKPQKKYKFFKKRKFSPRYFTLKKMVRRARRKKGPDSQKLSKKQFKKVLKLSQALRVCFELRNLIQEHRFGYFFKYPVNPYKLGLKNYWQIVRQPIDLTSIKQKFILGLYQKAHQFNRDMCRMFNNALFYNRNEPDILTQIKNLFELYDKTYSQIRVLINVEMLSEHQKVLVKPSKYNHVILRIPSRKLPDIFDVSRIRLLGLLLSRLKKGKKRVIAIRMRRNWPSLQIVGKRQKKRVEFNKMNLAQLLDLIHIVKYIGDKDFQYLKITHPKSTDNESATKVKIQEPQTKRYNHDPPEQESDFQVQDQS